jgi:7-keto-8-aminopelargonate synthetase-like enzyme
MRLSYAEVVFFKHNNFEDCERLIKKMNRNKRKVMVIESVYSMDGNIGNLPKARALCDKYNIVLVVDEAHGLGSLGKTGRGI